MKKSKGTVPRAIIIAGGAGGRLKPITHGKVNKANVEVGGKPLLAHQLSALKQLGVREVLLVLRPSDLAEFKRMIASGAYPKLKYSFAKTPFTKTGYRTSFMLSKVFRGLNFVAFAKKQPVAVTFGDCFYFPRFLKRALADFASKKRPLFLTQPEKVTTESSKTFHERVLESSAFPQKGFSPAIMGFIATPAFLELVCENISPKRRFVALARLAHSQGMKTGLMQGQVLGLNSAADYLALREVIAGRISFPFPEKWVRGIRPELERLTGRREDRVSHKKRVRVNSRHKRK